MNPRGRGATGGATDRSDAARRTTSRRRRRQLPDVRVVLRERGPPGKTVCLPTATGSLPLLVGRKPLPRRFGEGQSVLPGNPRPRFVLPPGRRASARILPVRR